MGSALTIPLPSALKKGDEITVFITYNTTKDCTAIGWLSKEWVDIVRLLEDRHLTRAV